MWLVEPSLSKFEKVVAADGFVPEFQYNLALSYEYGGKCSEAFAMWRSLSESSDNERLKMSVRRRLLKNFGTPGGRCFGQY